MLLIFRKLKKKLKIRKRTNKLAWKEGNSMILFIAGLLESSSGVCIPPLNYKLVSVFWYVPEMNYMKEHQWFYYCRFSWEQRWYIPPLNYKLASVFLIIKIEWISMKYECAIHVILFIAGFLEEQLQCMHSAVLNYRLVSVYLIIKI